MDSIHSWFINMITAAEWYVESSDLLKRIFLFHFSYSHNIHNNQLWIKQITPWEINTKRAFLIASFRWFSPQNRAFLIGFKLFLILFCHLSYKILKPDFKLKTKMNINRLHTALQYIINAYWKYIEQIFAYFPTSGQTH